jgi:hypothetical protein
VSKYSISSLIISETVKKAHSAGSVLDKKYIRGNAALTEEVVAERRGRLEHSQRKSVTRLARPTKVPTSRVRKVSASNAA